MQVPLAVLARIADFVQDVQSATDCDTFDLFDLAVYLDKWGTEEEQRAVFINACTVAYSVYERRSAEAAAKKAGDNGKAQAQREAHPGPRTSA